MIKNQEVSSMHNGPNYHHLQVHHCYPMVAMVSRLVVVVVIVTVVTIVVVVVAAAGIEFAFAPAVVTVVAMDDDEW